MNLAVIKINENERIHHLVLTLDQIKPYDLNPRRVINPRYQEIKDSILANDGLTTSLTVTLRPGEHQYMIAAGGNTRLKILNELWQETGRDCFYRIDCLVQPWKSDSQTLKAHLVENELRGDMVLIDKARAVMELKNLLQLESGKNLSKSEFERLLKQMGYPISRRQLTRFEYAAGFLEPLIPMALAEGLGGREVDRLQKICAAYAQCLTLLGGQAETLEPAYAQALLAHDDSVLNIDAIQRFLDDFLVSSTGHDLNRVRAEVDLLMFEINDESAFESLEQPSDRVIENEQTREPPKPSVIKPNPSNSQPVTQTEPAHPKKTLQREPSFVENQTQTSTDLTDIRFSNNIPETEVALKPTFSSSQAEPLKLSELPDLREHCYHLATAVVSQLSAAVNVVSWNQGYGFYLDIPERPIQDEIQYYVFWFLFGLSEQHLSTERIKLAQGMPFADLVLANQYSVAEKLIGDPATLPYFGFSLLTSKHFPESALASLFQLVQLCRQMRLSFRESDLFECITLEQIQLRDAYQAVAID